MMYSWMNLKMNWMHGLFNCDTARSVLEIPVADLVRRTDLEEETIKEVVSILASEFED
jgi:hypothetical protein